MMRSAVITGIGVLTPLERGGGKDEFWGLLTKGTNAVGRVSLFDSNPYSSNVAAEVKGHTESEEGRWMDFLRAAFTEALRDSGLVLEDMDKTRAGMALGTVLGGILLGERAWRGGQRPPEGYHLSYGASRLAETSGVLGLVLTVSTACASGTDAVGIAYMNILSGRADIMIAGGGDVLNEFSFSGFSSLGALTRSAVRPFDRGRDGLALGEGAAFLVLEDEKTALKRGARIYCRVAGYSSCADATHMTRPDETGAGLASAVEKALSKMERGAIGYINAHGTGTYYNDLMETRAIKRAFGKKAYDIPVSSIKSMIGHGFGAAGAIEAAVCALSISRGEIPPTINLDVPGPECDLDYVPGAARRLHLEGCVSLSAGFGGQNSAIVFCAP